MSQRPACGAGGGKAMTIAPGIVNEWTITVPESDTARVSGGETLPPVLSTPRLISYLERAAHQSVLPLLNEGQSTVGTLVRLRHLGASPVGMQVLFRTELVEVDRRRLRFKIEAWDEVEKVAEGEHERFIIEQARFEARLEEKRRQMGK
jgi:predicted thioesterase